MPASALPASLQTYVVEQDYARYDAADQAVWRFVLLHLEQHLARVAHPSYLRGLRGSALSPEAIPRISEVDRALSEFGFGAVAVSGFIPPRAFQRFQALGVLPIAADIRTPQHVAYTPAPDILHEAAGHAPILVNPLYGEYLKQSGRVAELAFSSAEDRAVTRAITELSRVKELHPEGSPVVALAERELERATAAVSWVSEAARMARLYWWTAEYGLIGTLRDFRLYGAGLLSSLGEAVHCLDPRVRKLPLDVGCLDVGYDITRPQPQLFVTPSFEALFEVLGAAERQLAVQRGVGAALEAAERSALPCRIRTSDGAVREGTLRAFQHDARETVLELVDGDEACRLLVAPGGTYDAGRLLEERGFWLVEGRVESVVPADESAEGQAGARVAPAPRELDASERELRDLYEQAAAAFRSRLGSSFVPVFERVHDVLVQRYPEEWLLRWNLLENLLSLGETQRTEALALELEHLERRFDGKEPIATGLRSLAARVRASLPPPQEKAS